MSVQEIKAAVAQLPAGELDELLEQLEEMRQELWDQQIERDFASGRFNEAIERAKRDIAAGLGKPI